MRAQRFAVEAIEASFGAILRGVPLATLSTDEFEQLHELWLRYRLLVFPDQHLTKEEQVRFARRFGELEFDIAAISNVRSDGSLRPDDTSDDVVSILRGNMAWHPDSTYMPVQAKGAVFSAHVVPASGGETQFADMTAAFEALDDERRALVDNALAYHSLYYSQAKVGHQGDATTDGDYSGYGFHRHATPLRPLVKTHPETGKKSLLIGRHAYGVTGMSEARSEAFLAELVEFACQPPRVVSHRWSVGDVVLWDNRCLLHRAMPWDMSEPRVMYHSRIAGDPVTEGWG